MRMDEGRVMDNKGKKLDKNTPVQDKNDIPLEKRETGSVEKDKSRR